MRLTSAAKVGFTAIIFALVLIGIYKGMGKFSGFSGKYAKAYNLYVSFITVKGLRPGFEVQLNGNRVGEVGKITNDGYGGVLVELKIEDAQQIHQHAKFTINRDNIFGGYMVSIDEPLSGHMIAPENNGQVVVRIAKGMVQLGGVVHKGGEEIGQVEAIDPSDPRSDLVRIQLNPGIEVDETMAFIPAHAIGGGLTGLDVYARLENGATMDGVREPGPEDLVADVDKALMQVTSEVSSIMSQVTDLISNFSGVLDKAKVQSLIDTISAQAILVADNVVKLSARLDSLVAQNQPHIDKTLQNIELVSTDAHTLVADLQKYNTPEFRQKIDDVATNLKTATESLNSILTDLKGLTSDKEMIDKIKTTIDKANSTLTKAEETLGTAKSAIEKAQSKLSDLGKIETGGDFTLRVVPDTKKWSGDLNLKLETKKGKTFVEGGITDIGENESLRAQVGRMLSNEGSGRMGIYKGKVGVGAEWRSKPLSLKTDVYNPNEITWDIFGTWAFSPELGVVLGVEDLLGDNEANLGLKIRF